GRRPERRPPTYPSARRASYGLAAGIARRFGSIRSLLVIGEGVFDGSSRLPLRLAARGTAPPCSGAGCGRSRRRHPHRPTQICNGKSEATAQSAEPPRPKGSRDRGLSGSQEGGEGGSSEEAAAASAGASRRGSASPQATLKARASAEESPWPYRDWNPQSRVVN